MNSPCITRSSTCGSCRLTKWNSDAFFTLFFCSCAFARVSGVTNVGVDTPNRSCVKRSSGISFGPGTSINLTLMLMNPTSSMSGVMYGPGPEKRTHAG